MVCTGHGTVVANHAYLSCPLIMGLHQYKWPLVGLQPAAHRQAALLPFRRHPPHIPPGPVTSAGLPAADSGSAAGGSAAGGSAAGLESDLIEWEEERTALEAIYDQDITFHSPCWTTLRLTVPGCSLADGGEGDAVLHLECWAPVDGAYPQHLPTLAARCGGPALHGCIMCTAAACLMMVRCGSWKSRPGLLACLLVACHRSLFNCLYSHGLILLV